MSSTVFTGFPQAGIQFLRDLSENNNKPWFEANKSGYIEHVQGPAVALVEAVGDRLQAHLPAIRYDTRTNGSGTLMRLHRDTRFSADKSPYKTNVAMIFTAGTGKKMETPGFGLQITPYQVDSMAGMFGFSKSDLATYREAVMDDKLGAALDEAAAQIRGAGDYTFGEETYKRVPAGFPADHPRAAWLKYTGLAAYAPVIPLEVAQTPALVDALIERFLTMAPIYHWLVRVFEK
jgi:uncharacterized protein (TIGR02453 family)